MRFLHEEMVLAFMPQDSLLGVAVTWCVPSPVAETSCQNSYLCSLISASVLATGATLACFPCIHIFGEFMDNRIKKRRAAKLEALLEDEQLSKEDISAAKGGRRRNCMCIQDIAERICCFKACSQCVSSFCGALCSPCKALGGVSIRARASPADVVALRVREARLPKVPTSSHPGVQLPPLASPLRLDGDADQAGSGPRLAGGVQGIVWRRCTVPLHATSEQLHSALNKKFRPGAPPGAARVDTVLLVPDNVLVETDEDCAALKHGDSLVVSFARPGQRQTKED